MPGQSGAVLGDDQAGAVDDEQQDGCVVECVARYVPDCEDPHAAEIAVTVVDDWQGRGLGTELLARLSDRAREEGIGRFNALVWADNQAMAKVLRNMSAKLVGYGPGAVEYQIALSPDEPSSLVPAGDDLSGNTG